MLTYYEGNHNFRMWSRVSWGAGGGWAEREGVMMVENQ